MDEPSASTFPGHAQTGLTLAELAAIVASGLDEPAHMEPSAAPELRRFRVSFSTHGHADSSSPLEAAAFDLAAPDPYEALAAAAAQASSWLAGASGLSVTVEISDRRIA